MKPATPFASVAAASASPPPKRISTPHGSFTAVSQSIAGALGAVDRDEEQRQRGSHGDAGIARAWRAAATPGDRNGPRAAGGISRETR